MLLVTHLFVKDQLAAIQSSMSDPVQLPSAETAVPVNTLSSVSAPPGTPVSSSSDSASDTDAAPRPNRPHQIHSIFSAMHARGYVPVSKVSNSLQGMVMSATKDNTPYIVKVVSKALSQQGVTIVSERAISVQEDIVKEASILRYLSGMESAPASLTRFIEFWEDTEYYYLVMEMAGNSLFKFVKKCHEWIDNKSLDLDVWKAFCAKAMRQMTEIVDWLHSSMNCCHLDISLENFTIKGMNITVERDGSKITALSDDFQIKLIDFGLAEVFTASLGDSDAVDFTSEKYVGKVSYEAPEVYAREGHFDARSADCFSLGVSFFMMLVGSPPFRRPCESDDLYRAVMAGKLVALLKHWGRSAHVDENAVSLFAGLFVLQPRRLNIAQIRQHRCLR